MKRGAAFWGLALGGGALALAALRRSASASNATAAPARLSVLGDARRSDLRAVPAVAPEPALPSTEVPSPPERAERPGSAPVPAWNRRADAGPPLFITDEVEALARVVTSEVGRGTLAERIAIGWCARNRARARRVTIARLVCSPCGKSSGNARPFSTMLPATPASRELAAVILASPQTEDPTQGATSCFEPSLQDRLHQAGRSGHRLDARGVRYCWLRRMDYFGSVGGWDLFGPKGGTGARTAPPAWNLEGFAVCCSGDRRTECRGKAPGDAMEGGA